ncbi:hypothetical protein CHS0354_007596 [Potamilus streckersoni]|uniref:Uncharacterized protein n=1 Tax=Potamilus streckersoni TaxID=2493646 RepID=A0AAE0T4S5_9BIVA|nr:hypothetical protein CHS0354_007596 [Potamilus streckersoni]
MEIKIVSILGTIVVMLHILEARPYFIDMPEADSEQDEIVSADKRLKDMNTNDLSEFQDPDIYSMEEIAEEGKINQKNLDPTSVIASDGRIERRSKPKRLPNRLCIVSSGTGMIIIPCWRRG